MPFDLFRWANGAPRVDLDLLYAPFLERLLVALAAAQERGKSYYATEGWRSYGRSMQLELAHLTQSGPRAAGAGKSAHNFGLAVDFALDADPLRPGLQPRWQAGDFDILGEEVERVGLVWGGRFKDGPHVQWPGFVTASELAPLDRLWRESTDLDVPRRLKVVWQYVTDFSPPED